MKSIVAGAFRNQAQAQDAVAELLLSGFSHPQITIRSGMDLDEYREQQSTTSVTRPRTENAWFGGLFRSLTGRDEPTIWEDAYSRAMKKDHVILTVETDSEERADRAADILNKHSPLEVDELFNMSEVEAYFAQRRAENQLSGGAHVPASEQAELEDLLLKRGMQRRGKVRVFPDSQVP